MCKQLGYVNQGILNGSVEICKPVCCVIDRVLRLLLAAGICKQGQTSVCCYNDRVLRLLLAAGICKLVHLNALC
jgi:hypothetical protein